jgi:signal transduction histidine kinase
LPQVKMNNGAGRIPPQLPLLRDSLSAKILVFSLLFGIVAIAGISLPVISGQSNFWLTERLEAAYLASLALEATPDGVVNVELQRRLLRQAGVIGVTLHKANGKTLMLGSDMPLVFAATYDLTHDGRIALWLLILDTMTKPGDKVIHITGKPKYNSSDTLQVDIRAIDLREHVAADTRRSAGAAVFTMLLISIFLYIFLQSCVVQRLRKMAKNIIEFRKAPNDTNRIIVPCGNLDEIGMSEQVLRRMQIDVNNALSVREHLASLGSGVAKILHDMRGLLSSALVASDALDGSQDPAVRHIASGLYTSIDRAVELCRTSVEFARKGEINLKHQEFSLESLVQEVLDIDKGDRPLKLVCTIPSDLIVAADRTQLYRAFDNLVRNSLEAKSDNIRITVMTAQNMLNVDVADNGTGIPENVRDRLFTPFLASTKLGSSGLGLSIARDILNAHGGDITLLSTGQSGTTFRLSIPLLTAKESEAKAGKPR